MKSKKKSLKLISLFAPLSLLFLSGCELKMGVLNPQGPVAKLQYDLIVYSFWLMMVVLVVVFALFTFVIYKYRERPDNMDYEPPNIHGSTLLEIIWTVIPVIIIIALAIPTIKSIYQLEEVPKGYEEVKPITIHVTSAEWKWIFSYPEQGIETVNYVNIPEDTPVKFQLTSAGTMGSFWIPELGGQEYTMPNHDMELILLAEHQGSYVGRNSNFNGEGFTHMEFEVLSQPQEDFNEWVQDVKNTAPKLTEKEYKKVLKPGVMGRKTFIGTHLKWNFTTNNQHQNHTTDNKKEETKSTQHEHNHH